MPGPRLRKKLNGPDICATAKRLPPEGSATFQHGPKPLAHNIIGEHTAKYFRPA
jgi:hypothetical protein